MGTVSYLPKEVVFSLKLEQGRSHMTNNSTERLFVDEIVLILNELYLVP